MGVIVAVGTDISYGGKRGFRARETAPLPRWGRHETSPQNQPASNAVWAARQEPPIPPCFGDQFSGQPLSFCSSNSSFSVSYSLFEPGKTSLNEALTVAGEKA